MKAIGSVVTFMLVGLFSSFVSIASCVYASESGQNAFYAAGGALALISLSLAFAAAEIINEIIDGGFK